MNCIKIGYKIYEIIYKDEVYDDNSNKCYGLTDHNKQEIIIDKTFPLNMQNQAKTKTPAQKTGREEIGQKYRTAGSEIADIAQKKKRIVAVQKQVILGLTGYFCPENR